MKRFFKLFGYVIVLVLCIIGIRGLVGLVVQQNIQGSSKDQQMRDKASRIHQEATVVDGHNDILLWVKRSGFDLGMNGGEPDDKSALFYSYPPLKWLPGKPMGESARTNTDLARLQTGGIDAQFFAVYESCKIPPAKAKEEALDRISSLQDHARRYPDRLEIAVSVKDIERINATGKLAALLGVEGGHMIDDSIENLTMFYDLGVRYMTLTHACSLSWADSATDEPVAGGLSAFGKSVVGEMNRLGMMIDISHVSDETFWDVVQTSKAPVIASHSNARSICDSPRNLKDEMIAAVKDSNGMIGVTFLQGYVDQERKSILKNLAGWYWLWNPGQTGTPISKLVDHIDHIVRIAGIDHVGIGSDFDGAPFFLEGLENVDEFPNLTLELLKRGYSETDIKKILGGNFLRVMADVQEIAMRMN